MSHEVNGGSPDPNGSKVSRRNTIQSILNDSDTSLRTNKPKKYSQPPIWARSWSKRQQRDQPLDHRPPPATAAAPAAVLPPSVRPQFAASNAQIGPGGYPSLLGLPASINGVLPSDSIATKICMWLYSNLSELEADRKYIEVEFKMGHIRDRLTNQRLVLPVTTEAVIDPNYAHDKLTFQANVPEQIFGRIETFMAQLEKLPDAAQLQKLPDARTRDEIFHVANSAANVRITYDENGNVIDKIRKQRIRDLMVYSPGDLLDWRISLSLETPYQGPPVNQPPSLTRFKNRQSWSTTGMQVDLTAVNSESSRSGSTKEVEFELDQNILVQCFDNYSNKSDPEGMDKFQELVRFGLDSCRDISRHVSR